MKTSTIALLALGALATVPAWAQQASPTRGGSYTSQSPYPSASANSSASANTSGVIAAEPSWRSPGAPAGAAQTTQAYVPNREVVAAVEQRLKELGYNVTPDGQYDANLRNNVLVFQSDHGLRPTGDVDLATIGSLGINVQPVGTSTAMVPVATTSEVAVLPPGYQFPLERNEHMTAPQVARQSRQLENTSGVEIPDSELSQIPVGDHPPAFPPGFPIQDIINFD